MSLDSKSTEEVITKANVRTQILKRIRKQYGCKIIDMTPLGDANKQ